VRRDLIELLYKTQVADVRFNACFCCPDPESIQVIRPPRDSKTRPQIDSPRYPPYLQQDCGETVFLAALTSYGFMVTPVSACPNVPRNAMGCFGLTCITQVRYVVYCIKDIDQHMLVTVSAISHGHLSELFFFERVFCCPASALY
jgi:hypothetical protein